jgi:hypothetical protein
MSKIKMIPPQYKPGGLHAMTPSEKIAHHTLGQTVQSYDLGDTVNKRAGYKYPGKIVSVFTTLDGKVRYVVEADHPDFRGMLHIFGDNDIEER